MAEVNSNITPGTGLGVDSFNVGAGAIGSGTEAIRQVLVIGDSVTKANVLAVDAAGRAAVSVVATVLTGSSTNVPVATPTNTPALNVATAGAVTFIVKNTTAASAYGGAPVLVFEQSDDNVSWGPLGMVRSDRNAAGSIFTLSANSANTSIMFDAALEGVNWVRCRCTTAPATNALTIVIQPGGGFFEPQVVALPPPSVTGTPTSVAASITVVTLIAANVNRFGYTVYNDSTATLYLSNAAAASLTAYSLQIAPAGYYECPVLGGRGYTGIVTALWSAAQGSARIVEHS